MCHKHNELLNINLLQYVTCEHWYTGDYNWRHNIYAIVAAFNISGCIRPLWPPLPSGPLEQSLLYKRPLTFHVGKLNDHKPFDINLLHRINKVTIKNVQFNILQICPHLKNNQSVSQWSRVLSRSLDSETWNSKRGFEPGKLWKSFPQMQASRDTI